MFYSIGPTPPHPSQFKITLASKKTENVKFLDFDVNSTNQPSYLPTYLPKGRQLVSRKKDLRTRRRVLCVD